MRSHEIFHEVLRMSPEEIMARRFQKASTLMTMQNRDLSEKPGDTTQWIGRYFKHPTLLPSIAL